MQLVKFIFICVVASILATACNGSSNTPTPTITDPECKSPFKDAKSTRNALIGQWTWIQSTINGRGGSSTETPASTGETRIWKFTDKEATYTVNGRLIGTYTYSVDSSPSADFTLSIVNADGSLFRVFQIFGCNQSMRLFNLSTSISEESLYQKK